MVLELRVITYAAGLHAFQVEILPELRSLEQTCEKDWGWGSIYVRARRYLVSRVNKPLPCQWGGSTVAGSVRKDQITNDIYTLGMLLLQLSISF